MFYSLIRYLQAWKHYGAAIRELSTLDDRELADLGITRSDIPQIAWAHARRPRPLPPRPHRPRRP